MGSLEQNSLIDYSKSIIDKQAYKKRTHILYNRPTNQPSLFKISPVFVFEDQQPSPEEFEFQYDKKQKTIEQVRVRWNSFIKIRQGNFLHEYEVIKQLGRGGYGTVYKVRGRYSNIIRAAKRIKKSELNAKQQQRLFNQVSILQSLDHPNIIKLYQVYEQYDVYVLIMQLCEGGELFKKLSKKQIKIKQSAKIIKQLLEAITYIHSKNVVHRDIKPQNILFDKQTGNIKLIDFGIAQIRKNDDYMTARIGTIYYIAPEVLLKRYKEKCDVWSAGVVLYMLIFGKPPFAGNNDYEIMDSILKGQIQYSGKNYLGKWWMDLPKACKQLLHGMLQKNPNNRFNGRQTLQNTWLSPEQSIGSKREILNCSANNMANFGFKNRLQAVVYTYCVSQLLSKSQKKNLQAVFKKCDTDYDGVISLVQFKSIMKEYIRDQNRTKTMMRLIDLDGSGSIQYTQFLVAVSNPRQLLNTQHYQKAFDYFDIDHSGGITYEQVAKFLQGNQSAYKIKAIFSEIDYNGDGNISRQEFVSLFLKQASKQIKKSQKVIKSQISNQNDRSHKKQKNSIRKKLKQNLKN